jgi:hypothetical protein
MIDFVKDLLAFVSLAGFSVTALTWMDIVSHLA